MAKKDNFGFNAESKLNLDLNLEFLNNIKFLDKLTYQQKKLAFFSAVIALVLVIAIAITLIVIGVNGGFEGNNGNNNSPNYGGGSNGEIEIPEVISDFSIYSSPYDTSYYVKDPANYSGLSVVIKDTNGVEMYVSYESHPEEFEFEGFDSNEPVAEQVITVKFRGFTDTFTIEVLPAPDVSAKLEKISISIPPKTTYKSGSAFNPTGGVILCEYSDGSERYVDLDDDSVIIHGYREIYKTVGEHELRVVYFDPNGKSAETTLTVIITE